MTATSNRPVRTQPWLHQRGHEIQAFGTVRQFPVGLSDGGPDLLVPTAQPDTSPTPRSSTRTTRSTTG